MEAYSWSGSSVSSPSMTVFSRYLFNLLSRVRVAASVRPYQSKLATRYICHGVIFLAVKEINIFCFPRGRRSREACGTAIDSRYVIRDKRYLVFSWRNLLQLL